MAAVDGRMTRRAEGNQVWLGVPTSVAPKLLVVDFQIRHRSTALTSPAIAMQHLLPQLFVRGGIKSHRQDLWVNPLHDALAVRLSRKACCCSGGRKRKNLVMENSRVSGSPLSRLAPARKSAQIISKQ
jgi:hypothetical protein